MVPTVPELRKLLATILAGAVGQDEVYWRNALGPIEKLPLAFHVRSNWRLHPQCKDCDRDAIDRAAEIVRGEYPYVAR